jgi:DNA helicase HerA-like ATPase
VRIDQFLPRPDQRMVLLGGSGTGKTTLAKALLGAYRGFVLAIDPKGTLGGPKGLEGYVIVRSPSGLRRIRRGYDRVIYRPGPVYSDLRSYDEVYRWAYERGKLLVYTDEIYSTMRGTRSPDWQRACITSGRELGVAMISSTQRPKGIDPRLLSESESIACFKLRKLDDAKYVSEFMGDEILKPPPRYAYWWWREGMDHPRLARLKLEGEGNGSR